MNNSRQVAVVTGSSTGIGRAIALRFADSGINVVLHGRTRSAELRQTRELCESRGVDCHELVGDFSREFDPQGFVQQAESCFGRIDIWINNAGGDVLTGDSANLELDRKLDYLWQTDVRSTLMLSRAAGRMMSQSADDENPAGTSGTRSIVNLGWDQAWTGMSGASGELFATTKGAIMSMTLSLAKSLAPRIRVNCVAPGWIKTEWGEDTDDAHSRRAVGQSLLKRWGTPADVAAAVHFLAGPEAAFVTGQIVCVNGGFDSEFGSND